MMNMKLKDNLGNIRILDPKIQTNRDSKWLATIDLWTSMLAMEEIRK